MSEWIKDLLTYIIPSKDVREHIQLIGHNFNDWEIAALIYNSTLEHSHRILLQHKLYRATKDGELKMQLRQRRFLEEAKKDDFTRKNLGCFYAVMTEWGDGEEICIGHYADFQQAKACGMKEEQPFSIEKYQIIGAKEKLVKSYMLTNPELLGQEEKRYQEIPYSGDPIGRCRFDKEGRLMDVDSEEQDIDWRCDLEPWDDFRYEDRFVYIPHPFKAGDLVHGVNRPEFCGMVITTDEDSRRVAKRKAEGKRVEYWDGALTILYLNECGEMDHEHIMPQYLERTTITHILNEKYNVLK